MESNAMAGARGRDTRDREEDVRRELKILWLDFLEEVPVSLDGARRVVGGGWVG